MFRTTLIIAVALVASACSSFAPPTANLDEAGIESVKEGERNQRARLDADYREALNKCGASMDSIRAKFDQSGYWESGIATVGIVAGAIVVPALAAKAVVAKSAVAGWGGVAGAANAGQYTLQQNGKSAAGYSSVYSTMRDEIKAATTSYGDPASNLGKRVAAINQLVIACRFPELPDVQTVKLPAGKL